MYDIQVVFGTLESIIPRIMRSIGVWASLALLVAVTAARNCGQPCTCDAPTSAPISGPEIVTYGEPCYCRESYPYAIQVPVIQAESRSSSNTAESLKSYGYSVETPSVESSSCSLQLPIKIQTPIIEQSQHRQESDGLRGRSYGVTVQRELLRQSSVSPNYSFDVAIQRPVIPVEQGGSSLSRKLLQPLGYQVEHYQERSSDCQGATLPVAIQIPVPSRSESQSQASETRLVGLTSRVDRILVPACECNDCPDCADVQRVC